jgi:hypothetical protein
VSHPGRRVVTSHELDPVFLTTLIHPSETDQD